MCLRLLHATVHKPNDSSTKRDKTREAHERLAITRKTTAGGKTANVRVKRVDSGAEMIRVWGAHERVAARRL